MELRSRLKAHTLPGKLKASIESECSILDLKVVWQCILESQQLVTSIASMRDSVKAFVDNPQIKCTTLNGTGR